MKTGLLIRDRSFYAGLFSLTFPLVLQQLLRLSVDTVNSILLGSIDQLQMTAVSQVDQVFFVYYTVCNGFAIGCCVLVAQYWGQRNMEAIRTVLATGLRAAALFGLGFTLVVMAAPELVMRIYLKDPEALTLSASYLRKVAVMYLPCALSVMIFGGCRGVEKVRIVLVTNLISYSVNIFLDYALLFGAFGFPRLGTTGVAVGTVAARFLELAICGAYLLKFEKRIGFRLSFLRRHDRELGRDLLRVSAPIVAHEIVWSLGTSTGSMITGQLGTSVVAGYNVAMVFYNLCASLGHGFLNACSVTISKTIGMGRRDEVKRQAQTMILMGIGLGFLLGGITLASRGGFLSLYRLEPEAVGYARQFMVVLALIWPFSLVEMVGMVGILRAGGDGKTGFYSDIVIMWMICIPLAALGAFVWKLPPVAVVAILKAIIALEALVGIWRVLGMRWIRDLTRHEEVKSAK